MMKALAFTLLLAPLAADAATYAVEAYITSTPVVGTFEYENGTITDAYLTAGAQTFLAPVYFQNRGWDSHEDAPAAAVWINADGARLQLSFDHVLTGTPGEVIGIVSRSESGTTLEFPGTGYSSFRNTGTHTASVVSEVPLPATFGLLGLGLFTFGLLRRFA